MVSSRRGMRGGMTSTMNNVSGRLIKGSAWMSASRAIVNVLSLLSTIVLARLLVPDDFGLVSLAMTFLMIVTSVTELSLSMALVRHEAPTPAHFDTAWTLNALRGLLVGALFAAGGWPVAAIYGDDRLVSVMAMLGGSMVPQIAMPQWMIKAGSISPVKWTIQALDGGIWHGISWSALGQTCGILLAMGAVMYAAGVFILLRYDT